MAASAKWQDEYIQLIDDCEARESRLTNWEREFMDSLRRYLVEEHGFPSSKQIHRLNLIWERVTAKG